MPDNLAFQACIAGRFDPAWQDELILRLRLIRLSRPAIPSSFRRDNNNCRDRDGRSRRVPRLLLADEAHG